MADSQDTETETTPLLPGTQSAGSGHASRAIQVEDGKHAFYVVLVVVFLNSAGSAIAVPPNTSILQELLCERYYARHDQVLLAPSTDPDCKAEPVQASLTMVKGFVGLLMLLPSLVLGVPYATLAEHWGIKRVLLLSIAGIFLGELWYDLVCWYGRSLPVELIYLTPVFYLIGGGASVGVSLLFVLVANASPAHLRPTRFFIMEASSVSGAIFGYMASSAIMDTLLWAPVLLGLGLIFLSFCLLLPVPDQRPLDAEPPEEGMLEPASDDDTPKSTVRTLHTAVVVLKGQGSLVILLLGYLLRSLGGSVMTLMIIYSAQAFNWSFSRSGYLASLDSTAHLAVLLLLPPLQRLLLSQSASDGTSNLFALARGSALLLAVGCAGMALAPSPAFFAISIVLYSLGGGYSQSIRSILTASTPDEHRAITYTVMGILDTVGTMVGAPVWPLVYRVGLKLAGPWIGLPFVTAAALFGGVYLTLFAGRQVNAVE